MNESTIEKQEYVQVKTATSAEDFEKLISSAAANGFILHSWQVTSHHSGVPLIYAVFYPCDSHVFTPNRIIK